MKQLVTYGRTVSANYQSERAEVTLEVPPHMDRREVWKLAKIIVNSQLKEASKAEIAEGITLQEEYEMEDEA